MVVRVFLGSLVAFAGSRAALAAEILALRHQLAVLERSRPARMPLTSWDRALWGFLLRHWSGWKDSLVLVKPQTVIGWHRRAFRLFWRRKSLAGAISTAALQPPLSSQPRPRADLRHRSNIGERQEDAARAVLAFLHEMRFRKRAYRLKGTHDRAPVDDDLTGQAAPPIIWSALSACSRTVAGSRGAGRSRRDS